MLEHIFKYNILYSQLVDNISQVTLNFIFREAKRVVKMGLEWSKCRCTLRKMYGLPRACLISKMMNLGKLTCMDEVCSHWKRLYFDDDDVMKDDKSNIYIMTE